MVSTQEEIKMLTKIQFLQRELDMCRWDNRELERNIEEQRAKYELKLKKQFDKFIMFYIILHIMYFCILI